MIIFGVGLPGDSSNILLTAAVCRKQKSVLSSRTTRSQTNIIMTTTSITNHTLLPRKGAENLSLF